jgi:pimeloyl-ACP methyl ester carboxylesterase
MPKAFVHGVPETSAIWGALVDELETRGIGDITLLTPPGFGAPVPQGWEPNQSNYGNWLLAELESLGGNVDLVGHDWGAGHVYGALAARPGLLRSWAADQADVKAVLTECDMWPVMSATLTRDIGRANNLEVWT